MALEDKQLDLMTRRLHLDRKLHKPIAEPVTMTRPLFLILTALYIFFVDSALDL